MNAFKAALLIIVLCLSAAPAFPAERGSANNRENPEKMTKTLSFLEVQAAVRATLDGLVDAYVNKNARKFMSFVAEDFTGDDVLLDRSIRRDFSRFIDMELRYTLNNVTTDSRNKKISVAVTYAKSYTDVATTRRISTQGSTTFTFRMVNGRPKLYTMKRPSLFILGE